MKSLNWALTLGLVIITVFAATWLISSPGALEQLQRADFNFVPPLALAFILSAMILYIWSGRAKPVAKTLLLYGGISSAIAMTFMYRVELEQLAAAIDSDLTLSTTQSMGNGEVSIRAARNGHFFASAMVNGTHVDFLVDTGATIVALTEFDALRLGFSRDELQYDQRVSTANGETFAAGIMLDQITVGDIEITDVRGVVLEDGLEVSLLGMTFLNKLGSFTVDQDRLIMRQ